MSLTFHLQMINHSFERIASWYHEFMHRTEACFRALHERVVRLEQERELYMRPTDDQVERVLRKILAEKFSVSNGNDERSAGQPNAVKEPEFFVKDPCPRPVHVDVAKLVVDPESVPSKGYLETIQMLDKRLVHFPGADLRNAPQQEVRDARRH